ncbi:MAG: hypothetical protein WC455_27995 [Dehalococcoidia bacterium]|jgi:hypothetical protein
MNLIEQVARLKEMEAGATPAPWRLLGIIDYQIVADSDEFYINFDHGSDKNDPEMITEMRNAAPNLLEVLGGFRPGDSEVLTGLLLANAPYGNPAREVLRRMRAMASKMEEQ